jgi:hypothetical protein
MGNVQAVNDGQILDALRKETDLFDSRACSWRVSVHEMRIKYCAKPGSGGWKTWKKLDGASELLTEWEKIKSGIATRNPSVVVRECVDNAQVLPPAGKMPPVAGLPITPAALIEQYGKTRVATLEILRFGAMLCDLDEALEKAIDKAPQGRRGDESLKGWLETHCPEIKYGTAMGYKALADDMRDYCKIPAKVSLSLAIPNADGTPFLPESAPIALPKLEKIQTAVWNMIDGKSTRQVRIGMGEAEGKPKGGAREKEKLTEEQKRERQLAAAKAWWTDAVSEMADQVSCVKSHALLEQSTLDAVFRRVGFIRDALKEAGAKE